MAVVTGAGLDREDGPDLLALEADASTVASIDAVFSRLDVADDFAAPRYDDASVGQLAAG